MSELRQPCLAQGQITELDGLRGVAIALVMLHHFWPKGGALAFASVGIHQGWIGVDLFFVISGFLITGILLDTKGEASYYKNFYARRVLRIFPLYYGFLLAVFTIVPMFQQGAYFSTEFLRQSGSPLWYLLYCGNIRESIIGNQPAYILAPVWSLSIEEQFYLTFPLIVAMLTRRQLVIFLVGCLVFAPAWRLVTFELFPENERIQYLATLSRIDVIAWGGLLAIGIRTGMVPSARWSGRCCIAALIVALITFLLNGFDRQQPYGRILIYSQVGASFALLVLWAVQSRGTRQSAWLRAKPLTSLGSLCYGIYLLQRPSEILLVKSLERLPIHLGKEAVVLMALKCAFAILVAWVSWKFFESPILSLKSYFPSSRHPANQTISTIVVEPGVQVLIPARQAQKRPAESVWSPKVHNLG